MGELEKKFLSKGTWGKRHHFSILFSCLNGHGIYLTIEVTFGIKCLSQNISGGWVWGKEGLDPSESIWWRDLKLVCGENKTSGLRI